MEWISNHILETLGLLGLIGAMIYGMCRLNNLKDRIERLESCYNGLIDQKMKILNSPVYTYQGKNLLSLTTYAIEVLEDIEFDKIFDLIKKEFCTHLDDHGLYTKYDVQEMAAFLMRKMRDDRLCDPLKQAAFSKGYNLDEILSAASIPLRDYYLSIHPKIKD